jgi:ectoine hydroxylase-related dioxygenase (phytanoyl-CoA dioxygenase family)
MDQTSRSTHPTSRAFFQPDQRASYEQNGFIVVRQMYSPDEVAAISGWIDELIARPLEVGKTMLYYEDSKLEPGKRIISRLEKFAEYHEGFGRLVSEPRMAGRVSELLGAPAVLFKEKVNFKLPGGDGFKAHQDIQPGWDDYADFFISVLVAVDDNTLENGCLELAAGHHKRGLIGRKWEPMEGKELEGIEFVPVPMKPGDVAFFDCFVPHQSAPNLTAHQRRNLYLTYNRASGGDHREQYFAAKRKNFPPDHEREAGKDYRFRV